jgi:hypothetical protein
MADKWTIAAGNLLDASKWNDGTLPTASQSCELRHRMTTAPAGGTFTCGQLLFTQSWAENNPVIVCDREFTINADCLFTGVASFFGVKLGSRVTVNGNISLGSAGHWRDYTALVGAYADATAADSLIINGDIELDWNALYRPVAYWVGVGTFKLTINGAIVLRGSLGSFTAPSITFNGPLTIKTGAWIGSGITVGPAASVTLDGGTLNSGVALQTTDLSFVAGQIGTGTWGQDITLHAGDSINGGQFSGAVLIDGGSLYGGEFTGSLFYLHGTIGTGTWSQPITLAEGDTINGGTFSAGVVVDGGSIGGGVFEGGCLIRQGQMWSGSFPGTGGLVIDGPDIEMDVWDMTAIGALDIRRGSLWLNNQGVLDLQGCRIRNHGRLAMHNQWGQVMTDAVTCVVNTSAMASAVLVGMEIPIHGATAISRSRLNWLGW